MGFFGNWVKALMGKGGNQQAYVDEGQAPVQVPEMGQQTQDPNLQVPQPQAESPSIQAAQNQFTPSPSTDTQTPQPEVSVQPQVQSPEPLQGLPVQPQMPGQKIQTPFNQHGAPTDSLGNPVDAPAEGPTGMPVNPISENPQKPVE